MNREFEENSKIRVTAAQIGVSKANWQVANYDWPEQKASAFMEANHYDILPIKSEEGTYREYWATKTKGKYGSIIKSDINGSNAIYYLTELKDLLFKFQESSHASYFLSDHKNINGLVSNVNLNAKSVYLYFYSMMSTCEIELGLWIKNLLPEAEIIALIADKSQHAKDELSQETIDRFNSDKTKNQENHFIEYLYFSQFEYILRKQKLTSALGYKSNSEFSADFKIIKKYRNWFAHPLNSPKNELSQDFHTLHIALDRLVNNISSTSPTLLQAYLSTSYETIGTPKFALSPGQVNEEFDAYLAKEGVKEWAFLTAENPGSEKLPEAENRERNLQLEKILEKQRFVYVEGRGVPADDTWRPENSYLVMNMGKKTAIELCEKFHQNAFIFGEVNQAPELVRVVSVWKPPSE